MKRTPLPLLGSLLLLGACLDQPTLPTAAISEAPLLEISHAPTGSGARFYWLPPMVKESSYSGVFDPTLSPVVEICANPACSGALHASFSMSTGSGAERVRLTGESYMVNWDTRSTGAKAGQTYRVRVLVGGQVRGHADVRVVQNGAQARGIDPALYVVVVRNSTLPIKFRIEDFVWAQIDAGGQHTCGLSAEGSAYCSGRGTSGQLGYGGLDDQLTPVPVQTNLKFASLSAGIWHTCGVTRGGDAYCWGRGWDGQLGNDIQGIQLTPVAVHGGHKFASVGAGHYHTCGVTRGGDAYCWGWSAQGQLGDGNPAGYQLTPVLVHGGHKFSSVAAGDFHTCGVTRSGDAYCWGWAAQGQLGNDSRDQQNTPVLVHGRHKFASLSTGDYHTCGATRSGDGYCWGRGINGRLGYGGETTQATPVLVHGGHKFVSLSATYLHTCGLTKGGDTYCWGDGEYGQLGYGGTENQLTPLAVQTNLKFASISGGDVHTCGRTKGGDAYCWGRGLYGRLGYGGTDQQNTPVAVLDPLWGSAASEAGATLTATHGEGPHALQQRLDLPPHGGYGDRDRTPASCPGEAAPCRD